MLALRKELVSAFYLTSSENKKKIIRYFKTAHPECSKKSITRLVKKIIVKEKRDDDCRPMFHYRSESQVLTADEEKEIEELRRQKLKKQAKSSSKPDPPAKAIKGEKVGG